MNDKTRIALEVLITEREGMIAKNAQRAYNNHAMAYMDEAFTELATQMRKLVREKAPPVISNYLTKEAEERARELRWKRIAWQEVIRLIKARQREIHSLGNLTEFGTGRLHETQEIRTAIEELCSP